MPFEKVAYHERESTTFLEQIELAFGALVLCSKIFLSYYGINTEQKFLLTTIQLLYTVGAYRNSIMILGNTVTTHVIISPDDMVLISSKFISRLI